MLMAVGKNARRERKTNPLEKRGSFIAEAAGACANRSRRYRKPAKEQA
jgi:hypothetical protein